MRKMGQQQSSFKIKQEVWLQYVNHGISEDPPNCDNLMLLMTQKLWDVYVCLWRSRPLFLEYRNKERETEKTWKDMEDAFGAINNSPRLISPLKSLMNILACLSFQSCSFMKTCIAEILLIILWFNMHAKQTRWLRQLDRD